MQIERETQIYVRPTKPHNVCALLFVGNINPEVVLTMNRQEAPTEIVFYDGFGKAFEYDPNEPLCVEKAASEAVAERSNYVVGLSEWTYLLTMTHWHGEVAYLFAHIEDRKEEPQPLLSHEQPDALPKNTVHTLKWLIPLATDCNVIKPLGMKGI